MRVLCFFFAFLALVGATELEEFETTFTSRSYNGTGNNQDNAALGSAGTSQLRLSEAEWADAIFTPLEEGRPTARELMTEVFLSSPPNVSSMNAVAVAWGQLLLFDLSYTIDGSEPFNIACDGEEGSVDVWCPEGAASDPIPFNRSEATESGSVRSPINHATSYIDLDFVYGRSKEEADTLRSFEGGMMKISEDGIPLRSVDGTWLIADQRTARFPVTFALHIVLLLEHNRCCVEVAPGLGYEGDEDIYQACRGWTIATFQHVTEDEFLIRFMGRSVGGWTVYEEGEDIYDDDFFFGGSSRRKLSSQNRRELLYTFESYDDTADPSADVFVAVAMTAAFESALPATLRIVGEGYVSTAYDHMLLSAAAEDVPGLFEDNEINVGDVLRGAVLSPAMAVGPHYSEVVSNLSPRFKLPVDAIQRGRDHGVPSYNAVREAYNLEPATDFTDVSSDGDVVLLLQLAYGDDIDLLDAVTGALAEAKDESRGGFFGDTLHKAWVNQLYRTFFGDRYHHLHSRPIENVSLVSISALINQTLDVVDLPESGFEAPEVVVCTGQCETPGTEGYSLADRYMLAWEVFDNETMSISLSALGIGASGMLGIGFGGLSMTDAKDYVICEVFSTEPHATAECIDRGPTGGRELPVPDDIGSSVEVTNVTVEAGWTTVTFIRAKASFDAQDYNVFEDFDNEVDTLVIYAFKAGGGVSQHPNSNRGSASVNFATGNVETECEGDTNFVSLHGALMLIAWMLIAPIGIYYARYRKGDAIQWAGREWYKMHEEIMIVASEAVLPLGITAVFASRGRSSDAHANWGYYMIAAVAMQIFTGWMRTKGLEAKHANFSLLHRLNKHFHIWAGRFAYLAGVVQCYRGLELVASNDELLLSAGDGLDLQLGSFGWVRSYVFPAWFAAVAAAFLFLEGRKQYHRFFKKGSANICGVVSIVNELQGDRLQTIDGKLIPRTMDLPVYSVAAFNDKVLSGQSWVMIDECVVDVADFAQRHPGGRRLILNGLGTDVTQEILGKSLPMGPSTSFPPNVHSGKAWRIIRSLVVGYIEAKDNDESAVVDDQQDEEGEQELEGEEKLDPVSVELSTHEPNRRLRSAAKAVMLSNRLALGDNNLASRAMRLNDIAAIPKQIPAPTKRPSPTSANKSGKGMFSNLPKEIDLPRRGSLDDLGWSSDVDALERFQVCPLLFRERMGAASAVGRGHLPSKRPVYRYIFSCPAKAQTQAQAISGVCYFNMRAQEEGKGVVQRAYNAFAVRLLDVEQPTPGGRVTWSKGAAKMPRVVPASETSEGVLCIELRIRMYHDGAMSKLLEKLSKDMDNPVVQLQGPFLIEKLKPPPAHQNVVMIAAGTGVNPMVQLIRDYLRIPRDGALSAGSRLALLWQTTTESDFFGTDEIAALEEKSNGLLEVTAIVSGGGRGRHAPGAAFRRARNMARSVFSSPAPSGSSAGNPATPAGFNLDSGSAGKPPPYKTPTRTGQEDLPPPPPYLTPNRSSDERRPGGAGAKNEQTPTGIGRLLPKKNWRNASRTSTPGASSRSTSLRDSSGYRVGDGLIRGKVNRQILQTVFGESLMASIKDFNHKRATSQLLLGDDDDDDSNVDEDEKKGQDDDADNFVGTDDTPGKLQVVVSGPTAFVARVAEMLTQMGVPSGSMVLLD